MTQDMRKSLFTPGFHSAIGPARIPGQAPKLLLGGAHLRTRIDTSAFSQLTAPARPLKEPVIPGATTEFRSASDVIRGLPLGADEQRKLELELREWSKSENVLAFRKNLMKALRSLAPNDFGLRMELGRRAMAFWKATSADRFDRRPGREGQSFVLKSAAAQIGEVRDWEGGKFRKVGEGKWEPVGGGEGAAQPEEGSHEHHKGKALAHFRAAMAHAGAHASARNKDEADQHQEKVDAAKEAEGQAHQLAEGGAEQAGGDIPPELQQMLQQALQAHGADKVKAALAKAAQGTAKGLDDQFRDKAAELADKPEMQAAAKAALGDIQGKPTPEQLKAATDKAAQDEGLRKAAEAELKSAGEEIGEAALGDAAAQAAGEKKPSKFRAVLRTVLKGGAGSFVFGFLDNFIMYCAGASIDKHIAAMGFSTAAVAGIGNAISDAVGQAAGDKVESLLDKMGLGEDDTSGAISEKTEKRIKSVASVAGVFVGALAGMVPMLFGVSFGKSQRRHTGPRLLLKARRPKSPEAQLSLFDDAPPVDEPAAAEPAPVSPGPPAPREPVTPEAADRAPKPRGSQRKKGAAAGGPYIGPRGGKWADPEHTIPWKEASGLVGGAKGGAKRYAKEARKVAEAAPAKPKEITQLKLDATIRTTAFESAEDLHTWLIEKLPKRTKGSALKLIKVTLKEKHPPKKNEVGAIVAPGHFEFQVEIDHQAAIPGHKLVAHIAEGVVTNIDDEHRITKQDYERAHNHVCDVCRTKRTRKQVYVVKREADGAHILVGGECAKEFQGANLATAVFALDDISDLLSGIGEDLDEDGEGGGGGRRVTWHPQQLVAAAWASAKHDGYISRGAAEGFGAPGTADRAMLLLAPTREELRNMTKQEREDNERKLADAQKQVAEEWDGIKAWIKGEIDAADAKGQFNEFMASLQALTDREAVDFKAMGRLAWVAHGYFKAKHAELERKKMLPEGVEPGPYRGGSDGKAHDLPGEWSIQSLQEAESDWGAYHKVLAMNLATGERIWFRQNKGVPDAWQRGHVVKLRGKVKEVKEGDKGPDGKPRPGLTFMTHVSEQPTKKEKAAAAKSRADRKAANAAAKKRWVAAAKQDDLWKQGIVESDYAPYGDGQKQIASTIIHELEEDFGDSKVSHKVYEQVLAVWTDQVEAAIRSSDPADHALGLRLARVQGHGGYHRQGRNIAEQRFSDLNHTLYSTSPTSGAMEPAQAEAVMKQWPNLRERIESTVVVKNDAWDAAQAVLRDAREKATGRAEASYYAGYYRESPLRYGVNLTGQTESSVYAERGKPQFVPGERMRTEDAVRVDTLMSAFVRDMDTLSRDAVHASGGDEGQSHIDRDQRTRRSGPGDAGWSSYASGGLGARKLETVRKDLERSIESSTKQAAEYAQLSKDLEAAHRQAQAELAEAKDSWTQQQKAWSVKRTAAKIKQYAADADFHQQVAARATEVKEALDAARMLGRLELEAEAQKHVRKSVTDADLERLRPRLMLRETSHPLELVWMAEEVPDELHEQTVRLPPGWEAGDDLFKAKYFKREGTPGNYVYFYRRADGSVQQVRQKHINPGSRGPYKKKVDKEGNVVITGGTKPPGSGWGGPDSHGFYRRRSKEEGVYGRWEFWHPTETSRQVGLFGATTDPKLEDKPKRKHAPIVEPPKAPDTQMDLFGKSDCWVLEKGAGHKYIRRIPTGKPRPKYRYIYRVPKTKGLVADDHLVEGSKFKVEHQGEHGHFEVRSHDRDKGVVTVRHDESGRTVNMRTKDLHRLMQRQVGKKTREQLKDIDKPAPLKLRVQPTQKRIPGTGKAEQKFPEPAKPKKPAPELKRASMADLGKGGFDNIEGFSQDPRELEQQAHLMKGDREFAIIPQAGGYVLASRVKVRSTGSIAVGDSTEVLLRGTGRNIQELKAEWAVVEADSLIASHDPQGFFARDDYPADVQERPYHRDKAEQGKVDAIARDMRPSMVANTNPDAINGAPIVTEQGVVLGGNGRTMGMQRAYQLYPESAKALREHLAQHARAFGVSAQAVSGMKNPVLVRRVKAEGTEEMTRLGRRMNEALTQGLDVRAAEVAVSKFVTAEVVEDLTTRMDPGQTLADFLQRPASKGFIEAIERAGIIDDRNKNQFVNAETGLLNEDGRDRVARVLAARLIPNSDLLDSMNQSWRENLGQAVPSILQAESAGWDLKPHLMAAVKADADMQAKGFKRTEKDRKAYLAQLDLMDTAMRAPEAEALLRILHEHGGKKLGLPQGFKQVSLEAARQKYDHGAQGSMFARPKVSAVEALDAAFPSKAKAAPKPAAPEPPAEQQDTQTTDMFASMTARDWGEELIKSGKVGAEGLARYVMHAVNWELDNLMRGELAVAEPGKPLNGERVLTRLRSFIVDQAHRDKDFARGMGVQPLDSKVLRGLVEAHAKANVAEIAKSLAKAMLWDTLRKSRS